MIRAAEYAVDAVEYFSPVTLLHPYPSPLVPITLPYPYTSPPVLLPYHPPTLALLHSYPSPPSPHYNPTKRPTKLPYHPSFSLPRHHTSLLPKSGITLQEFSIALQRVRPPPRPPYLPTLLSAYTRARRNSTIRLRTCYAKPGTDAGHAFVKVFSNLMTMEENDLNERKYSNPPCCTALSLFFLFSTAMFVLFRHVVQTRPA
eukprot:2102378-Rhodomonas_salina.2